MSEQRVLFADWEGENVMVNLVNGNAPAGLLEEINEYGIVVRTGEAIWWTLDDEPDEEGYTHARTKHVTRLVSAFFPWNVIYNVRVLEPDEAVERGF